MTGPTVSAAIDLGRSVMTALAINPPLTFDAGVDGTRLLTTMDENALVKRSRGPYNPDNSPWEAVATAEHVMERWPMVQTSERPEFKVELAAPWARLTLELPAEELVLRFVVPEDAPSVHLPATEHDALRSAIDRSLSFVADSLRLAGRPFGGEPPVSIALSYQDGPGHGPPGDPFGDESPDLRLLPVPTLEVDRSRLTRVQRRAHDEALWSIADSEAIEKVGDQGFTVQVGAVRVREAGI